MVFGFDICAGVDPSLTGRSCWRSSESVAARDKDRCERGG